MYNKKKYYYFFLTHVYVKTRHDDFVTLQFGGLLIHSLALPHEEMSIANVKSIKIKSKKHIYFIMMKINRK